MSFHPTSNSLNTETYMTMNAKDFRCICGPKVQKPPIKHTYRSDDCDQEIECDFGIIPYIHKAYKEIIIDFENKGLESYKIQVTENRLYHCNLFNISPSEGCVKPNKNLILKCSYKPKIPFQSNVEQYFLIGNGTSIKITLRGESIGPSLSVSNNYIRFFQEPLHKTGRKVIELKNATPNIPAPFTMDIDSKQKLFTVTPLIGVCSDTTFIVIHFNPPDTFGSYSQLLNIFVYGHPPIVINILGVYSEKVIDPNHVTIIYYPFPFEQKTGFDGCFRQVVANKKNLEPVSLSAYYLDLGRALVLEGVKPTPPDECLGFSPMPKSCVSTKNFNLTNNMEHDIIVNWIESDDVFTIFPKKVTISSGECMFFKCVFIPQYSETNYNRMFTAQIYWMPRNLEGLALNENTVIVPLNVTINLQGHSFPEGQVPLGHIEVVPQILEFPPSLINQYTFISFKLINKISRPITFKLIPPTLSRLVMTPMAGIITKFIVILAKFKLHRNPYFLEEYWMVELNGQPDHKITFKVTGIAGIPKVTVEVNNSVYLKTVQLNTTSESVFTLYNNCDFNLVYSFITPDHKYLRIEPSDGMVAMHGKVPFTVFFTASTCTPKKTNVKIKLYVQQKLDELVGPAWFHTFTVNTETSYSELSATPLTNEFNKVEYDSVINSSFYLYNFGIATVYYTLNPTRRSFSNDTISLDPIIGEVEANGKKEIKVTLECKTIGENYIGIEYYNRPTANAVQHENRAIELYDFSYECLISKIRVTEIVETTFGVLFSKKNFWEYLKVDSINTLLDTLDPNQTESIDIQLPECMLGSAHYVAVSVANLSDFDTEVTLKRRKLCDCARQEKVSQYKREYGLNCEHRKTLFVELTSNIIKKQSSEKLIIDVSYFLPGETVMAYELRLKHNRVIVLHFRIYTIPERVGRISAYDNEPQVTLVNGVLGAKSSPGQVFWFYNNSKVHAQIEVDTSEIEALNAQEKYKILECLYEKGIILPKSIWPFMIRFYPLEMKKYEVSVNISLNGEKYKQLRISAFGGMKPATQSFFDSQMPQYCPSTYKFPVILSAEILKVRCLPTWNYTEKIIFITNITNTKLIYYEWADLYVGNVIRITVGEKVGLLRPGKSRSLKVKIESFDQSILADFSIPCTLMDLPVMYAHKKLFSILEQSQVYKDDEFEYSDYPINFRKPILPFDREELKFLTKQVGFIISLTVSINIVDRKDLHLFMPISDDVFKYSPSIQLQVDNSRYFSNKDAECETFHSECDTNIPHEPRCGKLSADFTENLIENVISDVIFNGSFDKTITTVFEDTPIYYSQLNMDDRTLEQKKSVLSNDKLEDIKYDEIKKFFSRPTVPMLAETFKTFIWDSIRGTFNLTSTEEQKKDDQAIQETMEHLNELCTLQECLCPSAKP